MLIVPRKRICTQQPNGLSVVGIFGLTPVCIFNAADGAVDLVSKSLMTVAAGGRFKPIAAGLASIQTTVNSGLYSPVKNVPYRPNVWVAIWSGVIFGASTGSSPKFVGLARSTTSQSVDKIGIEGSLSGADYLQIVLLDASSRNINVGLSSFYGEQITIVASVDYNDQLVRVTVCSKKKTVQFSSAFSGSNNETLSGTEQFCVGPDVVENPSRILNAGVNFSGIFNGPRSSFAVEKSIAENPWQIFRAPDSRIFVPTGAGAGGGDSLTASNIIAAPATVGSPILSQQHTLSASSIATTPAIVASPAITQRHALSATAVSASPAVVGSPSITQRHALTATSISAGPAVVGSPTLTEIVAGVLSALPIVAAPAAVGAPAITQRHALSAGAISAGPATFGTPTLAQQHALMAQGITAGAAVVGAPALTPGGAALFTPEQLAYILAYVEANMAVPTPSEISEAVLAALQATAIPVNIKAVNDVTIKGVGTPANPWNPV